MGRIVVTEFVSVDGVMEDPGGGEGYRHRAWSFEFDRGEDGHQFKRDELDASDALLLGRVTYEAFAKSWPGRTDEFGFADKFNSMPKHVVSSTLGEPLEWTNSHLVKGDLVEAVNALKQQYEGDVTVHGSARLAKTLLEHDLVDRVHLMVFPVVLGTGKRLFGDAGDKKGLRLAESRTVGEDGVLTLVYEPRREPDRP